jgi:hypothetical protein
MSLTSSAPQPSLAWQFESSNVDSVVGLAPSSSTIDGSLTSAPTYVSGKYGQAVYFNNQNASFTGNANSYIRYNLTTFGFSSNSATVSCWINPSYTFPLASGNNPFYLNLLTGTTTAYYSFQSNADSNVSFVTGTSPTITIKNPAQTGVWNHYCAVFSNVGTTGASNTASYFYVNGTLVGSGNTSSQAFGSLNLGAFNNASANKPAWCSIDDLRLFNTALSAAQVQSIYNAQGMPSRCAFSNVIGSSKVQMWHS